MRIAKLEATMTDNENTPVARWAEGFKDSRASVESVMEGSVTKPSKMVGQGVEGELRIGGTMAVTRG